MPKHEQMIKRSGWLKLKRNSMPLKPDFKRLSKFHIPGKLGAYINGPTVMCGLTPRRVENGKVQTRSSKECVVAGSGRESVM